MQISFEFAMEFVISHKTKSCTNESGYENNTSEE